jgi:predicted dehydrogenase
MKACERETGRFVAIGYQTLYARETLWMKQAILAGRIGRLRSILCRCLWPRLDSYYSRNAWAGRLQDPSGAWILDSPFNNAVSHQLNMLCFLAGAEERRSAQLSGIQAELYAAHDIESADTACLRVSTREGSLLYFLVSHASETELDPEIEVRGESGSIHWDFEGPAVVKDNEGKVETMSLEKDEALRDSMLARVRARVGDPSVFICGLDIAGQQTLCVNGAHESSPVHRPSPDFVRRMPWEGSVKTVLSGVDEAIQRAFEEEKLFSEIGVPWAQPGKPIDLRDYHFFSGGRRP